MIISSVVVLLLCIRPNDHAGGLCMSPILLYRENWIRIVLFLSGFILVSSETIYWLLSFSEKQYVFDCVEGGVFEKVSCVVCRFFIEN